MSIVCYSLSTGASSSFSSVRLYFMCIKFCPLLLLLLSLYYSYLRFKLARIGRDLFVAFFTLEIDRQTLCRITQLGPMHVHVHVLPTFFYPSLLHFVHWRAPTPCMHVDL